jgi:hypothetical protein
MQAAQVAEGTMQLTNVIRAVPANDLAIGDFGLPMGCAADQLVLLPSFVGGGVGLLSLPGVPGDFAVAVLGTALQPVSLPPAAVSCTLLPAAHVLIPLPAQQIVDLPLPAAVRPVVFLAQAVVLSTIGSLTSTNALAVAAF